jgi:hypothetical protein
MYLYVTWKRTHKPIANQPLFPAPSPLNVRLLAPIATTTIPVRKALTVWAQGSIPRGGAGRAQWHLQRRPRPLGHVTPGSMVTLTPHQSLVIPAPAPGPPLLARLYTLLS